MSYAFVLFHRTVFGTFMFIILIHSFNITCIPRYIRTTTASTTMNKNISFTKENVKLNQFMKQICT